MPHNKHVSPDGGSQLLSYKKPKRPFWKRPRNIVIAVTVFFFLISTSGNNSSPAVQHYEQPSIHPQSSIAVKETEYDLEFDISDATSETKVEVNGGTTGVNCTWDENNNSKISKCSKSVTLHAGKNEFKITATNGDKSATEEFPVYIVTEKPVISVNDVKPDGNKSIVETKDEYFVFKFNFCKSQAATVKLDSSEVFASSDKDRCLYESVQNFSEDTTDRNHVIVGENPFGTTTTEIIVKYVGPIPTPTQIRKQEEAAKKTADEQAKADAEAKTKADQEAKTKAAADAKQQKIDQENAAKQKAADEAALQNVIDDAKYTCKSYAAKLYGYKKVDIKQISSGGGYMEKRLDDGNVLIKSQIAGDNGIMHAQQPLGTMECVTTSNGMSIVSFDLY